MNKKTRMRSIYRERALRELTKAYGYRCALCGGEFKDGEANTLDHIIPIACGGSRYTVENLQLAHFDCNNVKGRAYADNIDKRPGCMSKRPDQ